MVGLLPDVTNESICIVSSFKDGLSSVKALPSPSPQPLSREMWFNFGIGEAGWKFGYTENSGVAPILSREHLNAPKGSPGRAPGAMCRKAGNFWGSIAL